MEEALERMRDRLSRAYVEAVMSLDDPMDAKPGQIAQFRELADHLRQDLERVELALRLVRGGNVLPE